MKSGFVNRRNVMVAAGAVLLSGCSIIPKTADTPTSGTPTPEPSATPEPDVEIALQPADVEPYLGWYREEGSGREVEVLLQNGRLAVRIPEASSSVMSSRTRARYSVCQGSESTA